MASRTARVALIQNHIGLDGRSNVLASLVELLNSRGVVPDILTFSGAEDAKRFRSLVDAPIEFGLRRLSKPPILPGDLLQELVIPYLARSKLRDYDLVFTSSTAVYGYPKDVPLLRWICFPLEKVPTIEVRYQEPLHQAYGLINKLLYSLAKRGCTYHGKWLANSEFTRQVMAETYPVPAEEIEIMYGAIDTDVPPSSIDRERAVVSIGGFHTDKRQLEQIELARAMPDVRFYIIGGMRSRRYFEACQAAARDLPNVTLMPSAPREDVDAIFRRAKVFLHSKRYEHFGLGTVDGIAHGCIPVVHDSGGQREIVPFSQLRFQDQESAVSCLRAALDGEFDGLLPDLQNHIARFSSESFKAAMTRVFDEVLPARSTQHTG